MTLRDVLDDRQPETGTTGVSGTALIHAVKTFGQARQMLRRNARTIVCNRKCEPSV